MTILNDQFWQFPSWLLFFVVFILDWHRWAADQWLPGLIYTNWMCAVDLKPRLGSQDFENVARNQTKGF